MGFSSIILTQVPADDVSVIVLYRHDADGMLTLGLVVQIALHKSYIIMSNVV